MSSSNGKSTAKTILRVFAILFSIVLVPVLIVMIPAGGAVVTAVDVISKENIEAVIEKTDVAGEVYNVAVDEVSKETGSIKGVRKEIADEVFREVFRAEDVEEIIGATIDSVYSGKSASVNLGGITDRIVKSLTEVFVDGIDEVYSIWRGGTNSSVFTESYCSEIISEMEQNLLEEYSGYQVSNFADLEKMYDAEHGSGAFERLVEKEVTKAQEEVVKEFEAELPKAMDEIMEEAEKEVEDIINEAVMDPDFRDVIDIIQELDKNSGTIKVLVYVLIFGIVLFLLIFYLFDTPGFVVTAIPVIIGGAICKTVEFFESWVFSMFEEYMLENSTGMKAMDDLLQNVMEELLHPVFSGIGKFGVTMLIAGVALIGLAILRHVLKKQKQETEASYN